MGSNELRQVIITGGTGVTGNALVRYLLQQNIKVTALIRPDSFRKRYLPFENPLLTIVECGMDGYGEIDGELEIGSYDAFFHLSWDGSTGKQKVGNRNNFKLQNQNISYAIDAVELCHRLGCKTFVMTGSQAEYGRKNHPITEEDERKPENGYGMAKLCAEGMTRTLCKEYGIRHIWPVLFSVYGPNDATESLIDVTIRGLLKGETIPYTAGHQRWDYLYSYDAAKALFLLAMYGQDGEVYNVASGKSIELKEYIKEIYNILCPEKEPRLGEIQYSENQVMYLGAEISKLKKTTGFTTTTSFRDGVKEIADYIKREG